MVILVILARKIDKATLLEKNKSRADHVCNTMDLEKQPRWMFSLQSCRVQKKGTFDMSTSLCPIQVT